MQRTMTFMLLFMLSFSLVHDSFISLIEPKEHHSVSQLSFEMGQTEACTAFNEIHQLFHFMAIVSSYIPFSPSFAQNNIVPTLLLQSPSPFLESAYKPPIV